jgi:arylsulfatase A-like enzyme
MGLGGACLLGVLILVILPRHQTQPLCDGCNVILISIDTLGAKHTDVHNPELNTTPFLERFSAEQGIVFERAYAQAPWTLPSHTAMLTGLYPWDIGVEGPFDALPDRVTTVAEYFKEHGYTTAAFSTGAFVHPAWQFDQGFDIFAGSLNESTWNDLPGLLRDAYAWTTAAEQPFFLFVHSFHIHDPYGDPADDGVTIHDIVAANTMSGGPTPGDVSRMQEAYRREIRTMDTSLAEFFAELEAAGLLENTVVLITSDHGEEFGEHGTVGYHSVTVYDENIHVPLVLFIPNSKASRVPYSVEVRSVAATLLDVVGIAPPPTAATSLLSYIHGTERRDRMALARTINERDASLAAIEAAYASLSSIESGAVVPTERTEAYPGEYTSAALLGPYRVITTLHGATERYDVRIDPEQQTSLSSVPRAAARVFEDLQAHLTKLVR